MTHDARIDLPALRSKSLGQRRQPVRDKRVVGRSAIRQHPTIVAPGPASRSNTNKSASGAAVNDVAIGRERPRFTTASITPKSSDKQLRSSPIANVRRFDADGRLKARCGKLRSSPSADARRCCELDRPRRYKRRLRSSQGADARRFCDGGHTIRNPRRLRFAPGADAQRFPPPLLCCRLRQRGCDPRWARTPSASLVEQE